MPIATQKNFVALWRAAVDQSHNLVVVLQNGDVVYLNNAGCQMLGLPEDVDLAGLDLQEFVHPDYHPVLGLEAEELMQGHEGLPIKLCRTDGVDINVVAWINVFQEDEERSIIIEIADVTEQMNYANRLRNRERHLASIIDTMLEGLLTLDNTGEILSFNPAAEVMFGLSAEEAVGKNVAIFVPTRSRSSGDDIVDTLMKRKEKYLRGQRKDGEFFPIECSFSEWRDQDQRRFTMVVRDATVQEQYEKALDQHIQDVEFNRHVLEEQAAETIYLAEELAAQKEQAEINRQRSEYLANHDELTGLPNRRQFQKLLADRIDEANTEASAFGLLYVDLDKFKSVNDTMGHDKGDAVLVEAARRLQAGIREEDRAARLGGDEFAVITHCDNDLEISGMFVMAERLRESLQIEVTEAGQSITTGASIGGAVYPKDADTLDELLRLADDTMYEVKKGGRNHVRFYGHSAAPKST